MQPLRVLIRYLTSYCSYARPAQCFGDVQRLYTVEVCPPDNQRKTVKSDKWLISILLNLTNGWYRFYWFSIGANIMHIQIFCLSSKICGPCNETVSKSAPGPMFYWVNLLLSIPTVRTVRGSNRPGAGTCYTLAGSTASQPIARITLFRCAAWSRSSHW